jgi:cysteine desulfurase
MSIQITDKRQESLSEIAPALTEQFPIYCDHHATTPVDPEVLGSMLPFFTQQFGNPSSGEHPLGRCAQKAVEESRLELAKAINAEPSEIIFTSGATEANNLAIKGVAEAYCHKGKHLITVATEHRSVLEPMEYLEGLGLQVTVLPVKSNGLIDLNQLESVIQPDTILISVMAANNEIGILQPLSEIGKLARQKGILFHTDAAQAIGKIPLDVKAMSIDLMSLTAHKVYGPKGIGALYVRCQPKMHLAAQIHGGGQEGNLRSGTLNVPLIVGFGNAVKLGMARMKEDAEYLHGLRERLWSILSSQIPGVILNGSMTLRLPDNLNLSIPDVDGRALMLALRNRVVVSSGSACSVGKPSHVLLALGHSEALAHASLRFGLGRDNTLEQVEQIATDVIEAVHSLRQLTKCAER